MTYASTCVVCHRISGEGGPLGPDLTAVGERRDAAEIRAVIEDAAPGVFGDSSMPTFKDKLTGGADRRAGRLSGEPEVSARHRSLES